MTDTQSTGYAIDEDDPGFQPPAFLAPGEAERHHPLRADIHPALTYAMPDGYRPLQLDLYVPAERSGPVPCVIWIHGGAWLFGTRQTTPDYWPAGFLFQAAIDAGLAVASIDYRHSREAPFPAQLHDAKAAIRYLRRFAGELGLDPERFGVWGESAGGHLAALVALVDDPAFEGSDGVVGASSTVSAVVDFYGVADVDTLPSFFDSMPPEWIENLQAQGTRPPSSRSTCCSRARPGRAPRADGSSRRSPTSPRVLRRSCSCTVRATASCRSARARRCSRRCGPPASSPSSCACPVQTMSSSAPTPCRRSSAASPISSRS